MSQEMKVTITAKDGTSKTFDVIARSGGKLGTELEKAGKKGSKGLDEIGDAAQTNATKMDRVDAAASKVGAAVGTLAAVFAKAGDAAREQERLTDGLSRAYGDSAQSMIDFSNHIQDTTRYSNDAAQASLLLASSLSSNYGLAAEDIQNLASRAADMAATFGIELPDAMQRLSAAIRGEGESAEALGLNLSDAAVAAEAAKRGLEGWNTGGISEAEKAAFRYQLVIEQTEKFTGAAAKAADNAGGAFVQFGNKAQDGLQTLGKAIGPVGSLAAELAPLSLALPAVGAGIGKLGGAAGIASKAVGALGLVFNPMTLAVGALVAVGGLLAASWMDQRQKAQEYDAALGTLGDTFETLRRQGDTELAALGEEFSKLVDEVPAKIDSMMTDINNSMADKSGGQWIQDRKDQLIELGATEEAAWKQAYAEYEKYANGITVETEKLTSVQDKLNQALLDPNVDVTAWLKWSTSLLTSATSAEELQAAIDTINARPLSDFSTAATEANDSATKLAATAEQLGEKFEGLPELLDDLRIEGLDEEAADVQSLADAFLFLETATDRAIAANYDYISSLPAEDQAAAIEAIKNETTLSAEAAETLGAVWDRISQALASGNFDNAAIIAEVWKILNDPNLSPDEMVAALDELDNGLSKFVLSADEAGNAATRLGNRLEPIPDTWKANQAAIEETNQAVLDFVGNGDNILRFLMAMDPAIGALGTSAKVAVNGLSGISQALFRAAELEQSKAALDSILGIFQEIEDLAGRSEQAASIADNLIGAPGELGTLQELWEKVAGGYDVVTLSQEDYNRAVSAGIQIQESNVRVQDMLTSIQAKQIPLLAEQQKAYEQNISNIEQMGAAEQQYALYLQSTAGQSAIAQQYATAYAATLGQMPKDVATELIVNAAQADPVLFGVLEEMGLIEEGANGEITVDFPDQQTVQDAVGELTKSIDRLIETLGGVPPLRIDVDGMDAAEQALQRIESANGYKATTTVDVEVNTPGEGSTPAERIKNALSGLADKLGLSAKATVEVDADTTAADVDLDAVNSTLDQMNGDSATVEVDGNNTDAEGKMRDSRANLQNLDGNRALILVDGDNGSAERDIDETRSNLRNLDGDRATVRVNADTSDAEDGIRWARAYDGDVLARSYIDIYTRNFTQNFTSGGGNFQQHGGVVGYARGGVVAAEFAEAGPELLKFPMGGQALISERTQAIVPVGTYVQQNAALGPGGGQMPQIVVNLNGPVFGMSDLSAMVAGEIMPAIAEEFAAYYRGQGVFGG